MTSKPSDDERISSDINLILLHYSIDTSLIRITSVGGTVYVNGIMAKVNDDLESVDETLMNCIDAEIKEVEGVKWVNYYLENLVNMGGKWQHVNMDRKGSSVPPAEMPGRPGGDPPSMTSQSGVRRFTSQSKYESHSDQSTSDFSGISSGYSSSHPSRFQSRLGEASKSKERQFPSQVRDTSKSHGGGKSAPDTYHSSFPSSSSSEAKTRQESSSQNQSSLYFEDGNMLKPIGDVHSKERLFRARLVITNSYHQETLFVYSQNQLIIGRNAIDKDGQDLCLRPKPVTEEARCISGRHFSVFTENNITYIMDLGSRQTFVDGETLTPFVPKIIHSTHNVNVANILKLKISRVNPDPFPVQIENLGSVNSIAPAIFIERMENREEHAYVLVPSKIKLGIDHRGVLRPSNVGEIEIFSLANFLWIRGGNLPKQTCQPIARGMRFHADGCTIEVHKIRPEDMK